MLKIGDKVVVKRNKTDEPRKGKILDFQWNMIYIRYVDDECEWVESRYVKLV